MHLVNLVSSALDLSMNLLFQYIMHHSVHLGALCPLVVVMDESRFVSVVFAPLNFLMWIFLGTEEIKQCNT